MHLLKNFIYFRYILLNWEIQTFDFIFLELYINKKNFDSDVLQSYSDNAPINWQIQDASLGGSSDDEDFLGVLRGPSTFANAFLYVGLGTVALGLVIAFVGTGEKGFKTTELRLIGPSLIGNTIVDQTSQLYIY